MAATLTDVRATTRERILDAMYEVTRDFGIARATVEDVAQRAGLSRQTVYRYFPSKDHLVLALVLREEETFLDGTREAFSRHPDDLARAMAAAIEFSLGWAREHELLDRLLSTDQGTLLPYLTTRGLPVIARARDALVELVAERLPDLAEDHLRGVLDAGIRATLSYILTPSERPVATVARTLARGLVAALVESEVPA
jgi:AcrR family transcriptional regulator